LDHKGATEPSFFQPSTVFCGATNTIMMQQNASNSSLKSLYKIGGIAAFLQLAAITLYSIALAILGPKPTNAEEHFMIQQSSRLEVVLRGDFLLLVLIGLYLGTFPALYAALRKVNPIYTALATLFTVIAVTGTFATESTLSMLYLGEQYLGASSDAQRALFLAAGEAVIASDMWNSSAAYMGGILLQGSGVMISVIMLRSRDFRKVTAWSGILGNGFDLFQHIIHPFMPSVAAFIQMFMGVFYLVWYFMLGLDLLRLGRRDMKLMEANQ
jgi:hypothetical protein